MSERRPGQFSVPIDQSAAGTTVLVAAAAGRRIVVDSYAFTLSAAGSLQWFSNATGISGAMEFAANGGAVCPPGSMGGWLETVASDPLKITTVGARARGHLTCHYEG